MTQIRLLGGQEHLHFHNRVRDQIGQAYQFGEDVE